jgi:hypothetical protein
MKKTLIALAALGVVGAASAQVTITGSAMVALQKGSWTGSTTSFATPDFDINASATEDLGGGLSVSVATGITTNGGRGTPDSNVATKNEHYSMAVSGGFGTLKYSNFLSGTAKMSAGESVEQDVSDAMGGYNNVLSFAYTSPAMSGFTIGLDWSSVTAATATGGNATHPTASGTPNLGVTYNMDALTVYWENGGASTNDFRITYDAGMAKVMARTKTGGTTEWAVTAPVGAVTLGAHYGKNTTGSATAGVISYALSKQTTLKMSYATKGGGGGSDWRLGLAKTF